jgi:hypothetical protein
MAPPFDLRSYKSLLQKIFFKNLLNSQTRNLVPLISTNIRLLLLNLVTLCMLTGILVILRTGEQLQAPPSVRGEWTLSIVSLGKCQYIPVWEEEIKLNILQNGKNLDLEIENLEISHMRGILGEKTIKAKSKGEYGSPSLSMNAVIYFEANQERMEADLYVDDCNNPIVISGIRKGSSPGNYQIH